MDTNQQLESVLSKLDKLNDTAILTSLVLIAMFMIYITIKWSQK